MGFLFSFLILRLVLLIYSRNSQIFRLMAKFDKCFLSKEAYLTNTGLMNIKPFVQNNRNYSCGSLREILSLKLYDNCNNFIRKEQIISEYNILQIKIIKKYKDFKAEFDIISERKFLKKIRIAKQLIDDSTHLTLELSVIIPYNMFLNEEFCGHDVNKTISYVQNTIYLLNYYYRVFSIRTILMHVDIHTENDSVSNFAFDTYDENILYMARDRRIELVNDGLGYDATIFFTPYSHSGSTGLAFLEQLCDEEYSVAVATCEKPEYMVSTIAHEIGHLFGLDHVNERNNSDECNCTKICMMDTNFHRIHYENIYWSNCDEAYIKESIKNNFNCLRDSSKK